MEEIKFNFDNIDRYVYIRDPNTKRLIHRDIAYKEIYIKNKAKYPLPFRMYVVHHKDGNKFNNSIKNLQIVTREEHSKIHGKEFTPLIPGDVEKIITRLGSLDKKQLKVMFKELKKKKRLKNI